MLTRRPLLEESCRPDYLELPEGVRENIVVHFVKHYDEVFAIALGPGASP